MNIESVAQKAGVSKATVSYVINSNPKISKATADRVRRIIKELGYVPRMSRTRGLNDPTLKLKSGNIGLAIPTGVMSQSQFNMRLFEALHRALAKRSLKLVPIRMSPASNLQTIITEDPHQTELDGILLLYYSRSLSGSENIPIPSVNLLGHPDPTVPLLCDHVEPDNVRIGAMAACKLAERQHHSIAIIKPVGKPDTTGIRSHHPAMDIRCQSFLATGEQLDLGTAKYELPIELDNIQDSAPQLMELMAVYKSLPNKPTGIFVPSDPHLPILYKTFAQAGFMPGQTIEFIGCNNETMVLNGLSPTPSTIDIRPDALATTAVDILLKRISVSDERPFTKTYIEPTFIEAEKRQINSQA